MVLNPLGFVAANKRVGFVYSVGLVQVATSRVDVNVIWVRVMHRLQWAL